MPASPKLSDGVILMNYDQHYPGGDPGAVASQDWFVKNLQDALKVIPKEKIICAVGNYGYDWAMKKGQKTGTPPENDHTVSVQEAWLEAADSETDINFDDDAMNPHFAYLDGDKSATMSGSWMRVTALNQMRAAHSLGYRYLRPLASGIGGPLAVGGVGQAVRSRRDRPSWTLFRPGQDVDIEGAGEILRIQSQARGRRARASPSIPTATWSATKSSRLCPSPYVVDMYGGTQEKKVAITFDDGPDPEWTPKILDVLKAKNAKATFFLIGVEAEKYPGIAQADFQRRPRDRQSHLHPSRHQQHLQALFRGRAESDRAALRGQAGRKAGTVPAAVCDR